MQRRSVPSESLTAAAIIAGATATLLLAALIARWERPLRSPTAPRGVRSYAAAADPAQRSRIRQVWQEQNAVGRARGVLVFQVVLFILCAATLSGSARLVARTIAPSESDTEQPARPMSGATGGGLRRLVLRAARPATQVVGWLPGGARARAPWRRESCWRCCTARPLPSGLPGR